MKTIGWHAGGSACANILTCFKRKRKFTPEFVKMTIERKQMLL